MARFVACSRVRRAFVLASVILAVAQGWATSASAGAPTCTVTSTSFAFGNVNVLTGAAVDSTGTITVTCSGGGGNGQRLCINVGAGANASGSQRKMAGPSGATLNYELYTTAARTTPWGSWQTGFDSAGVDVIVAQNTTTPITVYTRLAGSQQTAVPGSYSTTFTAEPYLQYEDKVATTCPVGARNASTSTTVTATVTPTCSVTASSLDFGTVGFLNGAVDATATIQPVCSNGLAYTIALNGGGANATDPTLRKMSRSAEQITYGLYRDAGRTQPWGATTGSDTVAGTGTGAAQSVTVYGRVPAQSTPSVGGYSDSVVVTLTY